MANKNCTTCWGCPAPRDCGCSGHATPSVSIHEQGKTPVWSAGGAGSPEPAKPPVVIRESYDDFYIDDHILSITKCDDSSSVLWLPTTDPVKLCIRQKMFIRFFKSGIYNIDCLTMQLKRAVLTELHGKYDSWFPPEERDFLDESLPSYPINLGRYLKMFDFCRLIDC